MSRYLVNKFLFTIDRDPEPRRALPRGPARHGHLVGVRAGRAAAEPAPPRRRPPGWRSPTSSARRWRRTTT
nr:hypothetical protein [Angustibacter aerolatus]